MYESTSVNIDFVTHMHEVGFVLGLSQQYKYHPSWRAEQIQQYSTSFSERLDTFIKMEEETKPPVSTLKYVDVCHSSYATISSKSEVGTNFV